MGNRKLTLDIGASTIKLAEYDVSKAGIKLVSYAIGNLPATVDNAENAPLITAVLEEIAKEKGIKPGPVAVSISGQNTFTKFAAIPMAGGQERFNQLVRYEIEQNVPFSIDEMVCDYQILGDTDSGDKSVMIVSAKADFVEALTTAVRAAKFTPSLVDVSSLALTSAYVSVASDEGSAVILDIGQKTSSLVIVEGEKLYTRSIPVAGGNITREIASQFGCSQEEAEALKREKAYVSMGGVTEDEDEAVDAISKICRSQLTRLTAEISRSINFYRNQQGGSAPVKLYLTGASALLPQIDIFFAETLQVEVEFLNPLLNISTSSNIDEDALATDIVYLSTLVGLVLHEVKRSFATIDLMPIELVKERNDSRKIPFVAVSSVLAIGAAVLSYMALTHGVAVSEETLDRVNSRIKILKSYETKVKNAQKEFDDNQEKSLELRGVMQRRNQAVVELSTVKRALTDGMWIEKWVSVPEQNGVRSARITIRGWADDLKEVVAKSKNSQGVAKSTASELVVERLKMSPFVDPTSVHIAEMTKLGKNGAVEQFVVILNFGKPMKEGSK